MIEWFKKIFGTEQVTVTEVVDSKKSEGDDFMTQALLFPTSNSALHPNDASASSDSGSGDGDGGGSAGD